MARSRHEGISTLSATTFDVDLPFESLVDVLRHRAQHSPSKIAYTFLPEGDQQAKTLTYAELDEQVRAVAAQLQRIGCQGKRVLLLLPSGEDYVIGFLGCLYARAVPVTVYSPGSKRRLRRIEVIAHDADPAAVLTTEHFVSSVDQALINAAGSADVARLTLGQIPLSCAPDWQRPAIDRTSLAYLQFTSGSTAQPKGVMITHGNLLHNHQIMKAAWAQDENSVIVGWLPLFHDLGLIGVVLQSLMLGAHAVLMPPAAFAMKPYRWLQAISRFRADSSGAPNFAYDLCVRSVSSEQLATLDLSCWKVAFNGSESVRPRTLSAFSAKFQPCGFRPQAHFPCYGLAEATLFVAGGSATAHPRQSVFAADALEAKVATPVTAESERTRTLVSVGTAILDQQLEIVHPEKRTLCRPGEIGEIWLASPSVSPGYWQNEEQTKTTFHAYLADTRRGPYLRTGDLGFVFEDQLYISGRLKDLIIVAGRNHYPDDIEATVQQSHPSLRPGHGAAFAVDVDGEERPVVVVEVDRSYRPERQPPNDDRHWRASPNGHVGTEGLTDVVQISKVIRRAVSEEHELNLHDVVLLKHGAIPTTSSGKLKRQACRSLYLSESLDHFPR